MSIGRIPEGFHEGGKPHYNIIMKKCTNISWNNDNISPKNKQYSQPYFISSYIFWQSVKDIAMNEKQSAKLLDDVYE
jgi:hypothetical protein